jgi:hypothetical protein
MIKITHLTIFLLWASCLSLQAAKPDGRAVESDTRDESAFEDLAKVKETNLGQEYRIGVSGVCGVLKADHILVTHIISGSPADGKVQRGDLVRGLQHRGLGNDIRAMVYKRIYRLGRDWDWHLVLTVERPSMRNGKGNTLSVHLRMPPTPGGLYHYGPTGFFAKSYPDKLVIDVVEKGSPADGKLQIGDEILEVGGKPVAGHDFELFAQAIDHAESKLGGGILKLKIKRPADESAEGAEGAPAKDLAIELQLKVLGSYSPTAPINCPKTNAIITQTADYLAETGNVGILKSGLLGLLATGEKKYIDHVGKVLRASKFASPDSGVSIKSKGYVCWYFAYQTLILTEYYLLTGDEYVLPAIKQHALTIAQGQDSAGLWNHRLANPDNNFGQLHGRLNGYGAINQTSVTLWMSLILAEKCGIKHPEVRAAVEKTHKFYSNWIGPAELARVLEIVSNSSRPSAPKPSTSSLSSRNC